jgi:hypothetical protein
LRAECRNLGRAHEKGLAYAITPISHYGFVPFVRGRPDKPLLMAPGQTTGFAFLSNVAINPHLTSAMRDGELVNVVDVHPELLGIGIDDEAALLVQGNVFQAIGTGRVAIYDDARTGVLSAADAQPLRSWSAGSCSRLRAEAKRPAECRVFDIAAWRGAACG